MADSAIFDWVCGELTRVTEFSDIESRGTVRIALKKSGVTATAVTPAQMQVVVKRVLPEELRRRGCEDAQTICDELCLRLKEQGFQADDDGSSPEEIFARLGS